MVPEGAESPRVSGGLGDSGASELLGVGAPTLAPTWKTFRASPCRLPRRWQLASHPGPPGPPGPGFGPATGAHLTPQAASAAGDLGLRSTHPDTPGVGGTSYFTGLVTDAHRGARRHLRAGPEGTRDPPASARAGSLHPGTPASLPLRRPLALRVPALPLQFPLSPARSFWTVPHVPDVT